MSSERGRDVCVQRPRFFTHANRAKGLEQYFVRSVGNREIITLVYSPDVARYVPTLHSSSAITHSSKKSVRRTGSPKGK